MLIFFFSNLFVLVFTVLFYLVNSIEGNLFHSFFNLKTLLLFPIIIYTLSGFTFFRLNSRFLSHLRYSIILISFCFFWNILLSILLSQSGINFSDTVTGGIYFGSMSLIRIIFNVLVLSGPKKIIILKSFVELLVLFVTIPTIYGILRL